MKEKYSVVTPDLLIRGIFIYCVTLLFFTVASLAASVKSNTITTQNAFIVFGVICVIEILLLFLRKNDFWKEKTYFFLMQWLFLGCGMWIMLFALTSRYTEGALIVILSVLLSKIIDIYATSDNNSKKKVEKILLLGSIAITSIITFTLLLSQNDNYEGQFIVLILLTVLHLSFGVYGIKMLMYYIKHPDKVSDINSK